MSDRDARITIAMVIARMVHPSSERAALNWLETNSATIELLRLDTGKGLKLDKLYRLSDVLVKHHRTIEDALFARQRKLFGTAGAVIFYDLTNTHMTGRPASKLARFGRSRQKRNDCPLVTLALATDEGGFPRRSVVLPGNVSEPGTLLDALDSLATEDEGEDKPTVHHGRRHRHRGQSRRVARVGLSLDYCQAGWSQAGSGRGCEHPGTRCDV